MTTSVADEVKPDQGLEVQALVMTKRGFEEDSHVTWGEIK